MNLFNELLILEKNVKLLSVSLTIWGVFNSGARVGVSSEKKVKFIKPLNQGISTGNESIK